MIPSTVTDEVTPDRTTHAFPKIFTMAADQGIRTFEVRMVEAKRFPVVEASAWDRMKRYGAEFGIDFTAVSPGLFKVDLHSDLLRFHTAELLTMSLELAERLEVGRLITFGVERSPLDAESDFGRVVDLIGEAVDVAAARGFDVLLENIPGSWADTGENCLRILEGVGRSRFGYVWDTGNLYEAEARHFRTSYELLRPHIRDVHLKDGSIVDGRMVWQRFGTGETDIAGQVETLRRDGYTGSLTVEAKCEPHEDEDFIESVGYLNGLLAVPAGV